MVDPVLFENVPLFAECTPDVLQNLARYCNRCEYRKRNQIYFENDPARAVFVIQEGWVELGKIIYKDKYYRLAYLGKGDYFGMGEVFFDNYYISAVAAFDCVLLEIPKLHFMEQFLEIPCINQRVMQEFARLTKVWTGVFEWEYGANKTVLYLYFLANRYGELQAGDIIVHKHLTHNHIANMLNLTREYVTKLVHDLREQGAAWLEKDQLRIKKEWLDREVAKIEFADILQLRFQDLLED